MDPSVAAPNQPSDLVAQTERALFQLYKDPNPVSKSAADRWLQSLQASPQAWNLSWLLLQHQSVEVQNFGALMLHSKVTKAWGELPQEQYDPLRMELFKAIARFSSGARLVLLQLCRALVALAFQTMPDVWPNTIVSCIHTLRSTTQATPNSNFSAAALQLLTILPEEFETTSMNVVVLKRGVLRREIQTGLPSVLALLEEVLTSTQLSSTKNDAMKCCCSWVQFGLPLPEMSSLIDLLFQALLEEELFTQACETLTEITTHHDSLKYPGALRKLLQRILQLSDFIRTKLEEHNQDTCLSLCQLVQEVAEANMDVLVEQLSEGNAQDCEEALETVQLVLGFMCVPGYYPVDELCSEATFHFWENFLDQIANAEPQQSTFLLDFYSASISSLIEVFPEKAQYPPDSDWQDTWIDDDRDNFTKYREDLCDLGETLQRTVHIEYLQHLSSLLSSLLTTSSTPTWQSVEAVLFLLQGVASNVTQQSSPLIQNVLSLFPHMPPHPTLVKTTLSLLGCLSSWFKHHTDLLQAVLPTILGALTQPSLTPCATLAFLDVCNDCAEQLTPIVVQLIPACQAGLANPEMESRDCVRLAAAIGSILSSMPLKDLVAPLELLLSSCVQSLQQLAMEKASEERKPVVEKELAVLGALCHHIYPTLEDGEQHPVVLLLGQLWPSMQSLVSNWCTDQDVVESVCVCWNRAVRTVNEQYAPLLEGTVELIVKCYATVHYAKLLDSAAQLVGVLGKEESCSNIISALLQQLHSLSLPLFQSALSDFPDNVQAFLGLMTAALKSCPGLLLRIEGITNNLFKIGLAAVELPEHPTVTASAAFFVQFIGLADSAEAIREVLTQNGLSLVQYILQAIAGAAPRSYLGAFSDILGAMTSHCVTLLSQWLEELLSQEGFPTHHVTMAEKEQFKNAVLREQGNKRVLKERVREFALMSRGFHGTLYAIETS